MRPPEDLSKKNKASSGSVKPLSTLNQNQSAPSSRPTVDIIHLGKQPAKQPSSNTTTKPIPQKPSPSTITVAEIPITQEQVREIASNLPSGNSRGANTGSINVLTEKQISATYSSLSQPFSASASDAKPAEVLDYTHAVITFFFSKDKNYKSVYEDANDPGYLKKIPPHITADFLRGNNEIVLAKRFVKDGKGIPIMIAIDLSDKGFKFLHGPQAHIVEKLKDDVEYMAEVIVSLILDDPKYKDAFLNHGRFVDWDILGDGGDEPTTPFIADTDPMPRGAVLQDEDSKPTRVGYYVLTVIMKKITEKLQARIKNNLVTNIDIKACYSSLKKHISSDSKVIEPDIDVTDTTLIDAETRENINFHNKREIITISKDLEEQWENTILNQRRAKPIDYTGITTDAQRLHKEQNSNFVAIYKDRSADKSGGGATAAISYMMNGLALQVSGSNDFSKQNKGDVRSRVKLPDG